MNKKMYVMLGGYKGAGKNTVADEVMRLIRETYPQIHVSEAMIAKPLKDMAKEYFKWNGEKDIFGRALLQVLGDAIREVPEMIVEQIYKNECANDLNFTRTKADSIVQDYLGYGFDPLMDNLEERTGNSYPNQIIFVTDTRMMFEFTRFNLDRNLIFWIHADWAKTSNHVTESINPNDIPGIRHVVNVRDTDSAIRSVFRQVIDMAKSQGYPI